MKIKILVPVPTKFKILVPGPAPLCPCLVPTVSFVPSTTERSLTKGKIDCKNGYDEYHCEQLEKNECDRKSEYRCNDGECIDDTLGFGAFPNQCSERFQNPDNYCYKNPSSECENDKCPRLFFSCGDGYCYDGPTLGQRLCRTERDQRYLKAMPSSSSLTLFSHVLIIFKNIQPELICYNKTLCPYLSLNNDITTTHNGLPCYAFERFSNETYNRSDQMVANLKRLIRSCSLLPLKFNDPNKTCSMFECNDGSKCLSFHRLSDHFSDCTNGEDERQSHVCSLNLSDRFICDNGTKCFSEHFSAVPEKGCKDKTDQYIGITALNKCNNIFSRNCSVMESLAEPFMVRFRQICNGFVEYIADLNNNTDESDCSPIEWPCDRYFSKCDKVWNCPDGHDELGCNVPTPESLYCNNSEHFCLEMNNGHPICLSKMNVNDGIINCVGSYDEREFCRSKYPYELAHRYRCQNSTKCIDFFSICDCKKDCEENDDETIACYWLYKGEKCGNRPRRINDDCHRFRDRNYDGRSDLFCNLVDQRNEQFYFRHQTESPSSTITQHRIKRQLKAKVDPSVIWSCNRGIYVQSLKDPEGFACLCPEYYYGDRCQYQRKRVKIAFRMQMLTSFNHRFSSFKFLVLLIHKNNILSHNQFTYIPRYACLPNFYSQLLYPINQSYRSFNNYSLHIHLFDSKTLKHRYSRIYPLRFDFLPVQTIGKHLFLPEIENSFESSEVSIPYSSCKKLCSNMSLCLGHDESLHRDICICPMNFDGRRCLFPFDPCNNITCNGHGICQSVDVYRDPDDQLLCLCDLEWTGRRCDRLKPRLNVLLSRDVTFLSSNKAFLHIIQIKDWSITSPHYIYFKHSEKETSNLSFIIDESITYENNIFIQFYEHQNKFDYYLLFSHKLNEKPLIENTIKLQLSDRCRSINELFDENIVSQVDIRRVKNYQRLCLQTKSNEDKILCFYDDYLMCTCNEDNHTDCVPFQKHLDRCDNKWCNGRGMCVQDDPTCGTFSVCICQSCAYGSFCQFTTAGYSLSLDAIIASHILLTASTFSEQSLIIQVSVILISFVIVLGIILNVLSIFTFIQKETHETGCAFYLLLSSIIGVFTQITILCKMILLLMGDRNNVSCSIVEFFLKWCPTNCEWLNACVAIERGITVKFPTKYSRSKSKYYSKWIALLTVVLVGCICIPELLFHRIIIDQIDQRAWCVLILNSDRPALLGMYSILNIVSFLTPLTINIISAIIIVLTMLHSKQKTNQNNVKQKITWRIHIKLTRAQMHKHKHILLAPLILGCLSLPRLILTFVFVCTKLDQNSIPSLIAYLLAFLPSMAVLIAFVCPSKSYRSIFVKSIKVRITKFIRNLFS